MRSKGWGFSSADVGVFTNHQRRLGLKNLLLAPVCNWCMYMPLKKKIKSVFEFSGL
jgi:hypothetical protein